MAEVPHIPVLRGGREYVSLDTIELFSHRESGGTPVATVSQANAGIIRRDMKKAARRASLLRERPVAELVEACQRAASIFMEEELPLGAAETGGGSQGPADYVESLSATSGLPHTLCRANMLKVASVMENMPRILKGLMRGMELDVLDGGTGKHGDVPVWYTPNADALGAVLPSNSPGVHSLWVPAIALKTPVVLKPGREEPWTALRIARALMAAGIPEEAFSLYPTDHEGGATVLESCGRSLLFGDARTTAPYVNNAAIEVHGPGRSKVIFGADEIANWEEYLEVLVTSVAGNSGRSCINASTILVPSHADEIAAALAERLVEIEPAQHTGDDARLAAFANPALAEMMDAGITAGLEQAGAVDLTAGLRGGGRLRQFEGASYLLPTVIRCESLDHALARTEYMFPFTSVVEVPIDGMLEALGESLVVSAITRDPELVSQLGRSSQIHRLNIGPIPTTQVEWDQPHEGNLFEFLYTRRALQRASSWN
jgi:acyl-CoA reductase-like NAD-dependent aldehyde dehydrogenase